MRYFIGFLLTIGLIILIVVLLVGGGGSKTTTAPKKAFNLVDYANGNTSAQITIDGPIVADQNHETLKIIVSQSEATFNYYKGYQQSLIRTQSYPNNVTSYTIFLRALQLNNFVLHDKKVGYDERGTCATGERYIFQFSQNDTDLRRSWTTSCGSNSGSFRGNLGGILYLFKSQIPEYSQLTQGVTLN